MKQFAILGYPLGHTLSPQLHRLLARELGEQIDYQICQIAPEQLEQRLPELFALDGFNITIPYKVRIIDSLDRLDRTARNHGAVNVVGFSAAGERVGYNTDCVGFVRTMQTHGVEIKGNVCVLGAGGVGRMFATECALRGCRVTMAVRRDSMEKAEPVRAHIRSIDPQAQVEIADITSLNAGEQTFELMINATPVGMFPKVEASPVEASALKKVKTLFDYMLDTTAIGEPIGIEIWRVRGNYTEPPSYLEQRALSVLLYHVGMCEDYAAALTLLYRAAGLQAEYVPGITYSAEGPLVDHYWTMVMVDRQWYHVDPQLEDNISRHGYVRYRYFMRGSSIHASHWWGQNLIDSGMLTPEQEEDVRQHYLFPEGAEEDYPTPERRPITQTPLPDTEAIQAEIDAEFAAYEAEHGLLEPVELNWDLLIFGPAGYGPPD